MPKPQARCQRCRMWIDAPRTATKVPNHKRPDPPRENCSGSNQPWAEWRGPRDDK